MRLQKDERDFTIILSKVKAARLTVEIWIPALREDNWCDLGGIAASKSPHTSA
jgi:hypothetical protein